MTKRKFYKSTIVVTILHEDEDALHNLNLSEVASGMERSEFSGEWSVVKTLEINGRRVAKELRVHGNDPEFFHVDDKGDDLEPEPIECHARNVR